MLGLVPLLAWLAAVIAVRRARFNTRRLDDLILASLWASVLWGVYLVLVTEVLSLAGALRFGPLLACWAVPALVLFWTFRRIPAEKIELPAFSRWQLAMLAVVAVIVAVTGFIGVVSAPNTWDSMTYHLPRVMHWAQNGSVAHYATHEPRQLYMSPWAEIVATQFQILSGGDGFANLIQWFGMTGGLFAAGLLAGRLGAGLDGQILTMLAAATIPMGILQAVSTQTDHAVSFQVLTAVLLLRPAEQPGAWRSVLGAAAATGLAVLTKATAYLYLAPFLAVFSWRIVQSRRWRAWRPLCLFAVVVLSINLGHYVRNYRLFDSPLAPIGLGEYHDYANERFGLAVTMSNASRNAALHLAPGDPDLAESLYEAIRGLHGLLGIGAEDPRTTWPGMRFAPATSAVHEDFSGNFWHGYAILASLLAIATSRRLRRELPRVALHAALATAGFLLFASYLKWAPWHARLHLCLFLLWAPVVGTLMTRVFGPARLLLALAVTLHAVPFLFSNPLHPLRGEASIQIVLRLEQYFYARPLLGEFYRESAEQLASAECTDVGLSMPPDAWEYPLWVVARAATPRPMHFESLDVQKATRPLSDPSFKPCAVVCVDCTRKRRDRYAALFGEPQLTAVDDLSYAEENMLFLRPGSRPNHRTAPEE